MSESTKKPAIPSWQRAQSTPPTSSSPAAEGSKAVQDSESSPRPDAEENTEDEASPESNPLLEQASKWLQDPTIQDAPRDRKVAFLESKGVKAEDIAQLLGTEENDSLDISKDGERAWSKPSSQPAKSTTLPSQRDIPPIVTYPEFLTQSTKPPPLITARRIATTAYIAGALATTIYGLSKYIVAPMTETLHERRHDFASHTQEQLIEFNNKLSGIVSSDPTTHKPLGHPDHADDVSEADSDPTELFHRDYGTQTTPSLSRRPSVASEDPSEDITIKKHEDRLKILISHLRELEATHSNDSASSESLKNKVGEMTTYLSEMSYQNQYYNMGGLYGASNYGVAKSKDGKEDQVEAVRADIRAVKGVLLSARNFPAGGRNAARAEG